MRKALSKFVKYLSERSKALLIIVVVVILLSLVISILDILLWKYGIDTWISMGALIFVALAIAVNINTNFMTQQALNLTESMTRAFLTIKKADYAPFFKAITIQICNTGITPGDKVSVEISLFKPAQNDTPMPGIIVDLPSVFPNEERGMDVSCNTDLLDLINSEADVQISVRINYVTMGKERKTHRIIRFPQGKEIRQHSLKLEMLGEGSYWD